MPCGGRESRRSSSVRREVVRAQRPAAACLLLLRLLQGASSGASSAASDESSAAAVIFPVYVQPSGPVAEGRNKDNRRGPLGVDLSGALGSPCGSKEEPCSDIRSALLAIPANLSESATPELRLLPGAYIGDRNVFIGGSADADYPSHARNVSLVGWNSTDVGNGTAVLSCQGRDRQQSRVSDITGLAAAVAETSKASRGIWLSEGRITRLANLTVTECPGGGVGVELWPPGNSSTTRSASPSPSLSYVTLEGNGAHDCDMGGGLYVTFAAAAADESRKGIEEAEFGEGTGGDNDNAGSSGAAATTAAVAVAPSTMTSPDTVMVAVAGCLVSNNTARLGGGIAVEGTLPSSLPSLSTVNASLFRPGTPGRDGRPGAVTERVEGKEGARFAAAGPIVRVPGASETLGGVSIKGSTVVAGNQAVSGGGVWASGARVYAVGGGVVVRNNVAEGLTKGCGEEGNCGGRGGGVHIEEGLLYLDGVSFERNRAEAHQIRDEYAKGGGVSVRGSSLVEAKGCSFVGNSASAVVASSAGIGGGAYFDASTAKLRDCLFETNRAEGSDLFGQLASFGGGLATRGPSMVTTISDTRFIGNSVRNGGSGGGLWVEGGATATLEGSTRFLNNSAASSYTNRGAGGGLAVSSSSQVVISDGCVLEENVAGSEDVGESQPACLSGEGGAVYSSGSGVSLEGVILKRNRCETGALDAGCSGGAVSVIGRGASLEGAVEGGATFDRCVFEFNEARGSPTSSVYSGAGQGGAVAIRFSFPSFTNCSFTGNSADGGDGMAPATGGAIMLFLSRVVDAQSGGGNPPSTTPTFRNCTFEGNRAGPVGDLKGGGGGDRGHGIGGALAAIASSPVMVDCSFRNNSAVALMPSLRQESGHAPVSVASPSFGGAIVFTSDCSGSRLSGCTLEGNTAINGVGGDLAVLAAPSGSRHLAAALLGLVFFRDPNAAVPLHVDFKASSVYDSSPAAVAMLEDFATPFSPRPPDSNAGSNSTVVLSDCRFRPPPPQTEPSPPPWADDRSETQASPFLFVLDGGTVELLSPVFEASGQVFVAQVDGHANAHVSIVYGNSSSSSEVGAAAAISLVAVGGRISLSSSDGSQDAPRPRLDELVLLGASLALAGERGGVRGVSVASSARVRASMIKDVGGSGSGSDGDEGDALVNVTGSAVIGEAWEPKPFFLGTWLSQVLDICPFLVQAPRPPVWAILGDKEGALCGDEVALEGMELKLGGQSLVRGNVSLAGSAVVQVARKGTLTLAGDTTFYGNPSNNNGDAIPSSPASAPPVLRNSGVQHFPRGFSLTLEGGGILQEPSGSSMVNLPPPLFFSESLDDIGTAFEGTGDGGRHPLVVRSGWARFAGAITALAARNAGDAERVKMNRKWGLVLFESRGAANLSDTNGLAVHGPPGVSMQMSMRPMPGQGGGSGEEDGDSGDASQYGQWELVVEVAFIECGNMLAYANLSTAGGPCQACLLNMECAWCGGKGGGGCIPLADRPIKLAALGKKSDGVCQVGNCCPGGCNGVGTCDFYSATCSCSWLYAGSSCAELSTKGAVTLSLSLSAVLLLSLTIACGRSSRRKQIQAVEGTLQELRHGLLGNTRGSVADDASSVTSLGASVSRMAFPMGSRGQLPGGAASGPGGAIGAGSGSSYQHMWPKDYIQDLQQNLALRDVMVAFSELDVSNKIGSGAAGSVWKGSWRGAAVAIKVIRRPFHQAVELTGRDLEVFKREAYLMTRLRHPNIVLIMGVTFAPPDHRITHDAQGSVSMSISRRRELGFDINPGACQGSLCIVTELLSRGSLEDVIRAGGLRTASYRLILHLALQAARGMLYLHTHSPPIVHRDLKSSNLVVDDHWHVKVTDFGMSRFVPQPSPTIVDEGPSTSRPRHPISPKPRGPNDSDGSDTSEGSVVVLEEGKKESAEAAAAASSSASPDVEGGGRERSNNRRKQPQEGVQEGLGLTTNLGTVAWAAPEMLLGRGEYTAKVDVYSFGVVLWELWERRRPYEDLRSRFDIADTVVAGGRPPIGRGCPPSFAHLIRRCWDQDPTRRPSFQDIVEDLEAELGSVESMTEL